ncbi:MAG: 1,4-alpha-glucan branching protein domain-containing protein [Candidatus Eisenbacteria bacterium]
MSPRPGGFTLVLHSHLPWVLHHGRWPHGSDWLCEAVAECYLPLLGVLEPRARAGCSLGITLSMSPVLCEQLAHPDFAVEFRAYLAHRLAAGREDARRFAAEARPREAALAHRWVRFYGDALASFSAGSDLLARFRELETLGAIELITTAATHAYLPLLATTAAVRRQVAVAKDSHARYFGRDPRGFWLPECAYRPDGPWASPTRPGVADRWRPGLERVLSEQGFDYFFVESHLIEGGAPLQMFSPAGPTAQARAEAPSRAHRRTEGPPRAPEAAAAAPPSEFPRTGNVYRVGDSRVLCLGRDAATSQQVWSREAGYPGDPAYRDFHRRHHPGGLHYWAVTDSRGELVDKTVYEPERAGRRVRAHAEHLLAGVAAHLRRSAAAGATPQVCAMYDTELFGHWWFEGPEFLAAVLDRSHAFGVTLGSAGQWTSAPDTAQVLALPEGSWGTGGSHQTWLNPETLALWCAVHDAETAFEAVARRALGRDDVLLDRILRQAVREVMLLEASDWAFLITHRSVSDYAWDRSLEHARDADRLLGLATRVLDRPQALTAQALTPEDEGFLSQREARDGLFAGIDWRAGLVEPVREPARSSSAGAARTTSRASAAPTP